MINMIIMPGSHHKPPLKKTRIKKQHLSTWLSLSSIIIFLNEQCDDHDYLAQLMLTIITLLDHCHYE